MICVPLISELIFDGVWNILQIKSSQLDRLKSGVGFFNQNLSTDQKDAVVMFVGDYIDCFIQTLVGGAGCGKTAVSDEVLLLLNRYHVEAVPGDAL